MEVKRGSMIIAFSVLMSTFLATLSTIPENVGATTLYVGGAGPGNITTIQNAINSANPGDTIFVYGGTYNELITISKTLSLVGENKEMTIINGGGTGIVMLITANWVNVTGFTVTNGGQGAEYAGIDLHSVENCLIRYNKVADNYWGIRLSSASNNTIVDNIAFSNNGSDIALFGSNINNVTDNDVSSSSSPGITLGSSAYNTFFNNEFVGNGIHIWGFSIDYWNNHYIDISNTVNGKPIYYWRNVTGGTIPLGAGQVILANCSGVVIEKQILEYTSGGIQVGFSSNNAVSHNSVSNNLIGIDLWFSSNNSVTDNHISDSLDGISFYGLSFGNTIVNNTISNIRDNRGIIISETYENIIANNSISNSGTGLYLFSSHRNVVTNNEILSNGKGIHVTSSNSNIIANNTFSSNDHGILLPFDQYWITPMSKDNIIYHNSFIDNMNPAEDNGVNLWDNGYPTGGNYWSDYTGVDRKSGADQKQPGSDGVGDIPHYISLRSWWGETEIIEDKYPLMSPFVAPPSPPDNQLPTCIITTPVPRANVSGTIRLSGTASDPDGTVENVEIRIDNNPWVQATGTTSWSHDLNTKIVSNGNHTIHVRSYDGTAYSAETYLTIFINNSASEKPEQDWFWAAVATTMILVAVILLVAYILIRKKNGQNGKNRSKPPTEEDVKS